MLIRIWKLCYFQTNMAILKIKIYTCVKLCLKFRCLGRLKQNWEPINWNSIQSHCLLTIIQIPTLSVHSLGFTFCQWGFKNKIPEKRITYAIYFYIALFCKGKKAQKMFTFMNSFLKTPLPFLVRLDMKHARQGRR